MLYKLRISILYGHKGKAINNTKNDKVSTFLGVKIGEMLCGGGFRD